MASDEEVVGAESPGKDWSVFWSCVWWAPKQLAASVDSLVWWLWGGAGLPAAMDTLNTLLLGWLFSAVLILVLVKFLYDKFLRGSDDEEFYSEASGGQCATQEGASAEQTATEKKEALAREKREARREPTIVPSPSSLAKGSAGPAAGQDADAVRWINSIMQWMFQKPHKAISGPYLALLNDMTAQTALETGVLIEVLEILPATPSPQLRNVVVDCTPDDSMHLTCDCETRLYLRLQTTRTHREVTTESEYAAAVCPFIGRVNAAVRTHECAATLKFDGWPEVEIELEGIRNNEVGLGEKELQEVIKEVVAGAIRSMVLVLDLRQDSTFPRFKRARELPDRVMPVGYDSMVRERMTHPPVLKSRAPVKPRDIPSVSLKDSRYQPETLLERQPFSVHSTAAAATAPTTTSNLLTQNASAVLTASEERLIARNLSDYDMKDDHSEPIDYSRRLDGTEMMMWDRGYVPANFLEQVKAVTMAKVEEKTMSEPRLDQPFLMVGSNRRKMLDEPKSSPALPPAFDYIPYDSEYEEDEDFDDYLEKRTPLRGEDSRAGGSKPAPVVKSDEVFIPTESDIKSMVTKVADMFSPKATAAVNPTKGLEALTMSATPLGAMGLPHHPKSHFSPSLSASLPPPSGALNGKRLLVKIVKATGIGCDKGLVDGYVVVEMDEPNQKFTTATVKGSNSPFWDEQFLFELSDITLELLFELYNESDSSFLGLGIVGIEELVATPSQRQIIPLQSRPYENDAVSGSMTVEFLFLDGADLPDLTVRCSNVQQSRSSRGEGLVTTVTTTYAKAPLAADVAMNGMDSVAASALRDIERSTGNASAARSTIIIHASKKPEDEVEEEEADSDDNYVVNTLQYPFPGTTSSVTSATTTTPYSTKPGATTITDITAAPTDIRDEGIDLEEDERGRDRTKRKRDSFFGTLKKRFSRSKVRSQSVEPTSPQAVRETTPGNDMPRTATVGRSVSMERSTRLRPTGLLSVPKLDNRGDIGVRSGGDTGSTRSSLSETSGLSSSSTRTYVNEASMLIVETVENGLVKHYLVPVSLQQRNRWKKRGTKLHVFSGHTFVAKHISRSLSCAVCEKTFPRRPGKQGYECRDCGLNTHKPCHVRTEVQCPNSKVNNMDLVYITDPREERRNLRNQRL